MMVPPLSTSRAVVIGLLFTAMPSVALAQSPGTPDALNAVVNAEGSVFATAVQPDGKILVAGSFTTMGGVFRPRLARLNQDGSLDGAFYPYPSGPVHAVLVQEDGSIIIGGSFNNLAPGGVNVTTRQFIAKLRPNGTLDGAFNPSASDAVWSLALQPDGKILVGGQFLTFQPPGVSSPQTRPYAARLLSNGTLDATFQPRPNGAVWSVTPQPGGKILMAGAFTEVRPGNSPTPVPRPYLARFEASGTLDSGFQPTPNEAVHCTAFQPDGKILVGGNFTAIQSVPRGRLARLQPDGSLDEGFVANTDDFVRSIALQSDGMVLVSGWFRTVQPAAAPAPLARRYLARVDAAGQLDDSFFPAPTDIVSSVGGQGDGRILAGGNFQGVAPGGADTPTDPRKLVRLHAGPASQSLTTPSSQRVLWRRSGALPEVSQVTFQESSDGGATWRRIGVASRVGTSPDWELTGISLTPGSRLRALGRTTSGTGNGSGGFAVWTGVVQSPYQHWTSTEFPEGSGMTAPADDPDLDGIINGLEFAFGTSPLSPITGALPLRYSGLLAGGGTLEARGMPTEWREGSAMHALFLRRPDASGLVLTPQFGDLTGAWIDSTAVPTVLTREGDFELVAVPFPADGAASFFRLKVALVP